MIDIRTEREKAIAEFSWACGVEEGMKMVLAKIKERSVRLAQSIDDETKPIAPTP